MEIYLNLLKIIESLRWDDVETGTELKAKLESRGDIRVTIEIETPVTRADFIAVLTELAERTEAGACRSMLHFEMHGDEDGVEMTSGEVVSWDDVGALLRRINLAMKNELLVTAAVCKGAYVAKAAAWNPFIPSPFCGVIGPDEEVHSRLLVPGFDAFFSEFLRTGNVIKAFRDLKAVIPEYRQLDMATLFTRGVEQYLRTLSEDAVEQRVAGIVAGKSEAELNALGGRSAAQTYIRGRLLDPQPRLKAGWRKFIMADVYPENDHKFVPPEILNR